MRVIACTGGLTLAVLAYRAQLLLPVMMLVLTFAGLAGIFLRELPRTRERFRTDFVRELRAGNAGSREILGVVVRCLFWLALPSFIYLTAVPAQLDTSRYVLNVLLVPWFLALLRVFCELRPPRAGHSIVVGLSAVVATAGLLLEAGRFLIGPPEPGVELALPAAGTWVVLQGGVGRSFNHHYPHRAQRYALDLVATEQGKDHRGEGKALEDYHCWGRPLIAPADGTVVGALDGLSDSPIGQRDPKIPEGNHVVLELEPEHYLLLGHLKQGSVAVRVGDTVRAGQLLGRCGNSGNTSQPHVHLQVQTRPELRDAELHTLPIHVASGVDGPLERAPRRNDELSGTLDLPAGE